MHGIWGLCIDQPVMMLCGLAAAVAADEQYLLHVLPAVAVMLANHEDCRVEASVALVAGNLWDG